MRVDLAAFFVNQDKKSDDEHARWSRTYISTCITQDATQSTG